ncbi:MAG: tetratricopeptide repeat protein [Phycisphaeraceae bacterium]|nr:tetratricopeptide repeat protein [Phycisphaeraceae bacterium]
MAEEEITTPVSTVSKGGEPTWAQVWHLPVLLLGLLLFVAGLYLLAPRSEPNNFPGALDSAAYYLETKRDLEQAKKKLDEVDAQRQLASQQDIARYNQLYADWQYEELHRPGFTLVPTRQTQDAHERIVNFYQQSENLGRHITGTSLNRWAQSLVALGRDEQALSLLEKMRNESPQQRYHLIGQLIEDHRARPPAEQNLDVLTKLVQRYRFEVNQEPDPKPRRAAGIWITEVEADMKLTAGDPHGAIRLLVMERLPRLMRPGQPNHDLAPLYIKLGQSYQHIAAFDDARLNYMEAQAMLAGQPHSDRMADILVGLGQIELSRPSDGSVQTSRGLFAEAVNEYPSSSSAIDAKIGLADCEARLNMESESAQHFREAVEDLVRRTPPHDIRRQIITDTIDAHVARAVDREDYDRTLELLEILIPLYGDQLPPAQLLRFAVTHERIAEKRSDAAQEIQARLEAGDTDVSVQAKQLAYQQAVIHYEQAGDYYLDHANSVTITDDQAHGESLWHAAACYDEAQLWSKAIDVYSQFVSTRINDPLCIRARAQLGKAYLADGQYEPAIEQFLQLLEDHPHSPETYDILVPLAQAYIAVKDYSAARRGLEQVVTDHPSITPESPEYQYALIELGKLLYQLGDQDGDYYVPAIERLTEAVQRYGEADQGPMLRFLLADSYRKSVARLNQLLGERQSKNDQLEIQAEKKKRLEMAQQLYNQVITELEARPQVAVTPLEQLYRRNAYFYQADCAFDRGAYELAISLYDLAARRFENSPASLIALVQIVNAHCELGQYQEARVANNQARLQLQRIPDDAFEEPDLPLTRRHWEDWLRWTSQLDIFGPKADASR